MVPVGLDGKHWRRGLAAELAPPGLCVPGSVEAAAPTVCLAPRLGAARLWTLLVALGYQPTPGNVVDDLLGLSAQGLVAPLQLSPNWTSNALGGGKAWRQSAGGGWTLNSR